MKYSLIIPALNAAETLPDCLNAISNLRRCEQIVETILVDDGSADGTRKIAEDAGCRVIRNESPKGPAAARNAGARSAVGDILLFVDSDILLPANAIDGFDASLDSDPRAAAVVAARSPVSIKKNLVSRYKNYWTAYKWSRGAGMNVLNASALAFRREVFYNLGGFDEEIKDAFYEDDELGHRMSDSGLKIAVARDVKAVHMKEFTLAGLLARDSNTGYAKYVAGKRGSVKSAAGLSYSGLDPMILLSCPLMFSTLAAALAASVISGAVAAIFLLAVGVAAVIAINFRFWGYIAKSESAGTAWLRFVPIFFIHVFVTGTAQIYGFARGVFSRVMKR